MNEDVSESVSAILLLNSREGRGGFLHKGRDVVWLIDSRDAVLYILAVVQFILMLALNLHIGGNLKTAFQRPIFRTKFNQLRR